MQKTKAIAMSYDGVAYVLPTSFVSDAQAHLNTLFKALDPFQNGENEWRRALNLTAKSY